MRITIIVTLLFGLIAHSTFSQEYMPPDTTTYLFTVEAIEGEDVRFNYSVVSMDRHLRSKRGTDVKAPLSLELPDANYTIVVERTSDHGLLETKITRVDDGEKGGFAASSKRITVLYSTKKGFRGTNGID